MVERVAIVGGGIVGLAFAWEAAERGHSVVLFDRNDPPSGASIRNFGMIWPIGQPAGRDYDRAMLSRSRWLELAEKGAVWAQSCGSLHVAYADDEAAVLREFTDSAHSLGIDCQYLDTLTTRQHYPHLNHNSLRGALFSPTELVVNPPVAIRQIGEFLQSFHNVKRQFGTAVVSVDQSSVRTADGKNWPADRVIVCSGIDFETLFPETFAAAGLRRCKLQMMKTVAQPGNWKLGPHIAGGLTLCHYKSFERCPSLTALKERIAREYPEYVRLGIHVMASQNDRGEVVIGDSHEYDADITPFDKMRIDELILEYLRSMLQLPDWTIASHWHGLYAKHPTQHVVIAEPQPGCTVVAATGGAGMTLSFGIAREWWEKQSQ